MSIIPASCQSTSKGCAVHVVFHGCQQGAGEVGDYVYSKLGHNEWDDTNNMRRSLTSLLHSCHDSGGVARGVTVTLL